METGSPLQDILLKTATFAKNLMEVVLKMLHPYLHEIVAGELNHEKTDIRQLKLDASVIDEYKWDKRIELSWNIDNLKHFDEISIIYDFQA